MMVTSERILRAVNEARAEGLSEGRREALAKARRITAGIVESYAAMERPERQAAAEMVLRCMEGLEEQ